MRSQHGETSGWTAPSGLARDAGLHLRELGSGAPALLLLHGLAASNLYFGAAFDGLADRARLLVPDLLGFGRSPRPADSEYGPEAQVDALIDALERLQLRGPVVVGAHSAGTLVALRLASRRPDWVQSVVAFGPPLYRSSQAARAQIEHMGLWTRLFAMDTPLARLSCAWMCRHRRAAARIARWLRPDLPRAIAEDAVQHSWASYSRSVSNLIVGAQPSPDLARLACPVTLVAGECDPVVDGPYLREIAEQYAHVTLQLWPGAHDLPLTQSARCVDLIRARLGSAGD